MLPDVLVLSRSFGLLYLAALAVLAVPNPHGVSAQETATSEDIYKPFFLGLQAVADKEIKPVGWFDIRERKDLRKLDHAKTPRLALAVCTADVTCFGELGALSNLVSLRVDLSQSVEPSDLSSEHIDMIGRCSTLEYLAIPVDGLDQSALSALEHLRKLRQLEVVWCRGLVDGATRDLSWISQFASLEYLSVADEEGPVRLDAKSLAELRPLKAPATLKVDGVVESASLKTLVARMLPSRLVLCGRGQLQGLPSAELKSCNLAFLSMREYTIDDVIMQDLTALTCIRSLSLESCCARWGPLAQAICKHLANLQEICLLRCSQGVHGTGVSGQDLVPLKSLKGLKRLTIQGHLTEGKELLTALATAPALEAMLLGSGIEKVDDSCLDILKTYPCLTDVRFEEANQAPKAELVEISEDALKAFREQHPKVRLSMRTFPRKQVPSSDGRG